jgi:hypothetical protein
MNPRFPLRLALIFLSATVSAATYHVGSLADLNTRISNAVAGDVIIVSNGVYSSSSALNVTRIGTAANPILIRAETIGGVEITGAKGFTLGSPAAYITIEGFKFTHAGNISIASGTSHCRFTRNIVELAIPAGADVSYFNINGDDVQIDYNELRNKSTLGEMLDIAGSGSQVARRLWVHHNYFHDFTSPGGNGAETIRWGLSGLSLSTGDGLCEYNLFVRCRGENEMISNKSSGNTYRYNTVLDCAGGEISQRHGNDCLYYGNYMRNTQGMRIYGDRHKIFSNYFESNSIAVNMGNGDGDVYNGAALTAHDRPDDNVVAFNTFVNNTTHYQMGGRTGGLGSSNTVVADNLFLGGGSIGSISSSAPYTGTWTNNIRWQTSSTGNVPVSGYLTINPLLARDASGIYHLTAGSPAINAGTGAYDCYGNYSAFPYVGLDMDGQVRDALKDVGADEFTNAPVVARLLTTNDVGPFATVTAGPTNHLVAHLTFDDGTAGDSSGHGNNGVLVNGATVVADAERGNVLLLDGTDDYVDLGNDRSLDLSATGQATLAAWVKVAVNHNHNTILSKGEWKEAYALLIKGDTTPADLLWTGNDTSVFSGDPVPLNTWTHVAVVMDGALTTFYLNGQPSGAVNQDRGGAIDATGKDVCLGREQYDGALPAGRWFFNGWLDDVRIYDEALSAADVHGLALASAAPLVCALTVANDHLVLRWTGGLAPYQVQVRPDLNLGAWQDLGGTSEGREMILPPTNATEFYRIKLP